VKEKRSILTDLALELPYAANAITLSSGELLIAGKSPSPAGGVLRLSATCAGARLASGKIESILPISLPKPPSVEKLGRPDAEIALPHKPPLSWHAAWLNTWHEHLDGARERIKSKVALGALLLLLIVRFIMNRWGLYSDEPDLRSAARRVDVLTLCIAPLIALLALGIPPPSVQMTLAVVAALLGTLSAARLWMNEPEHDRKFAWFGSLAASAILATLVIGTYVGDAAYHTLSLLTNYD
jgi:hypothetical protein